jgi:hypothetical protein
VEKIQRANALAYFEHIIADEEKPVFNNGGRRETDV